MIAVGFLAWLGLVAVVVSVPLLGLIALLMWALDADDRASNE